MLVSPCLIHLKVRGWEVTLIGGERLQRSTAHNWCSFHPCLVHPKVCGWEETHIGGERPWRDTTILQHFVTTWWHGVEATRKIRK